MIISPPPITEQVGVEDGGIFKVKKLIIDPWDLAASGSKVISMGGITNGQVISVEAFMTDDGGSNVFHLPYHVSSNPVRKVIWLADYAWSTNGNIVIYADSVYLSAGWSSTADDRGYIYVTYIA